MSLKHRESYLRRKMLLSKMHEDMRKVPRCLGVCLFYNDEDIAADAIEYLLENNHEVVVWDHGSTDGTAAVIDKYRDQIVDRFLIPRSTPFKEVFRIVSERLIQMAADYDWVSFPESDEFLEGPDRKKSYYEHIVDMYGSGYDWIVFDNMVYWFTEADDMSEPSPVKRIKHYSIRRDCGQRVYSWRARCTNIRRWNHNDAVGLKNPVHFKTRHYQMRSVEHLKDRVFNRCLNTSKNGDNHHFELMRRKASDMLIHSSKLHFDDGVSELSMDEKMDWASVYGDMAELEELRRSKRSDTREDVERVYRRMING